MKPKKKPTLAQARRGELVAPVKTRGKTLANTWFLFDPSTGKDVVVIGDLRMEHFYAVEGDPAIRRVSYNPAPVLIQHDNEEHAIAFDAVVTFMDGAQECRHVAHRPLLADGAADADVLARNIAAAQSIGAKYRSIGPKDLDPLRARVQNWRRALGALKRCFGHPLELVSAHVHAHIQQAGKISIADLLRATQTESEALVMGALVKLLRSRSVLSDLDSKIWSGHTMVWVERKS